MKPTEEELAVFYEHYCKPFMENASDSDMLLMAAYAVAVMNDETGA